MNQEILSFENAYHNSSMVRILRSLSRFVPDNDSLEIADGVPSQAGALHSYGRWSDVRDYSSSCLHPMVMLILH